MAGPIGKRSKIYARLLLTVVSVLSIGPMLATCAGAAKPPAANKSAKVHDEQNWHVTDLRLAAEDLVLRSRLTPPQQRELAQADQENSRVIALRAKGDFRNAIPLAEHLMATRRRVLGEQHPDTATSVNNLAFLYQSMGDYAKAEPLYRQALEIEKKVLGENHESTARTLTNLAGLYFDQGDYAKAEPLFRKAVEITKKVLGENHPRSATTLGGLAVLYHSMADYAKAEALYRRVLEIRRKLLGENHPDTATSINNLAELYRSIGDVSKVEPLLRQALEIRQKVLGENHPETANSFSNLAALYSSKADFARAEPLLRRALEINKKVFGENHPDTATRINNLAFMYDSMGDHAKAEELYRQVLEIRQKVLGENHPDTAQSFSNLALLYYSMGDYAKAEPLCRRALEIYERHFANTFQVQSERQQLLLAGLLRVNLDKQLAIGGNAGARASDLYRHVLLWKGAVFVRQLANRTLRRRRDLKARFDELASVDVRLATLALRGPGRQRRDAWEEQVAQLSRQKDSLERSLSTESAEFREQRALLHPKPEDLQTVLLERTALVDVLEYWHGYPSAAKPGQLNGERRLVAFVVRHDRHIVRVELGPSEPITEAVQFWLDRIKRAPDTVSGRDGAALRALIWQKLEPLLEGCDTVLISPDGSLNRLPFAALPGAKDGSYLFEEMNLVVVPVPRLLLQKDGPEKPGDRSLLIVGDVNYDGSHGKVDVLIATTRSAIRGDQGGTLEFARLKSTSAEVANIRTSFQHVFPHGQVRALSGDNATEANFRHDAPNYHYLHLATHGFFAPPQIASALAPSKEEPGRAIGELTRKGIAGAHPGLLSGVALSGANTPSAPDQDDGILTAIEVAGLDLERADLVVLSACETGLGAVAGGEGVMGLQRAFQIAGAKNVVASLWKVNDQATAALMGLFYHKLWVEKKTPAVALREAQLWILNNPDRISSLARARGLDLDRVVNLPVDAKGAEGHKRSSPYLWAGFAISGAGR
jgi:CHAT domain-containing protein/tetratricopeptide (TPR) repeat protein